MICKTIFMLTSSGSDNSNKSKRLAFHCCITERSASRSNIRFSVAAIVIYSTLITLKHKKIIIRMEIT